MDDLASILADAQAEARGRMTDECVVTRPGVNPVFDPTDGTYGGGDATPVYEGLCRLRTGQVASSDGRQVADDRVIDQNSTLSLPADAPVLRSGDIFRMTKVPYAPWLEGLRAKVATLPMGSHMSAARYQIEAVTG